MQHPEQLQQLRKSPDLLSSAVDECLRHESPAQFIGRVALEDIQLHGQHIKQGTGILLVIGSANRDEQQFEHADHFNIQRNPNPYLSFGKGKHACVGGALVRQEVEIALAVLLESFDNMQLLDTPLEWTPRLGHRWLKQLPISATK